MNGIHLSLTYFQSILFSFFQRIQQTMKYWLSHLPLEVWVDCYRYPWISRRKLARKMHRFRNRKFAEYLQFYLHDWGKRKLDALIFSTDGLYKYFYKKRYLDVPRTPMPANIRSFERIQINHFNAQTVNFLRQVRPILSDVNLQLSGILPSNLENFRTILANLLPLLNGIHLLFFDDVCALPTIEQCFGNEKLNKLKMLKIFNFEENAAEATINFLLNWLAPQQQEDNNIGPKWFEVDMFNDNGFSAQISTAIRQEFLTAKSPHTFAFFVRYASMEWEFAEFHLQNSIGEELHGVHTVHEFCHQIQITRHRANCGTALQEWIEENKEKMNDNDNRQIWICSPTIGPLDAIDPPENEDKEHQPSTSKDA